MEGSLRDIFPPYLLDSQKDLLRKELDAFNAGKTVSFYLPSGSFQNDLLQGDAWTAFDIIAPETGKKKTIKGMILSNTCDINTNNARLIPAKIVFAPLIELKSLPNQLEKGGASRQQINNKLNAIRAQRVTSIFYLPGQEFVLETEYVAMLDHLHNIDVSFFLKKENRSRIFTLSQMAIYLFLIKLSLHFCRFHDNVNRYNTAPIQN